jgi:Fibronectin type III domain
MRTSIVRDSLKNNHISAENTVESVTDKLIGSFGAACAKLRISPGLFLGAVIGIKAANPIEAKASNSVTLTWDKAASHTNLSSFILKWGTTSGHYPQQMSVATNLTTATVDNLVSGVTYYFVVTAKNVANLESDPSNELAYTVSSADIAPKSISGIYASSPAAGVASIAMTGTSDSAFPSAVLQLWYSPRAGQYTQYQEMSAGTTNRNIGGLRPGATYHFVARLFDPITGLFGPSTSDVSVSIKTSGSSSILTEPVYTPLHSNYGSLTNTNTEWTTTIINSNSNTAPTLSVSYAVNASEQSTHLPKQLFVRIEGSPGKIVYLQSTETISGPNVQWSTIESLPIPNNGLLLFRTEATEEQRFFRAVSQ